jgi:hypothetical protein
MGDVGALSDVPREWGSVNPWLSMIGTCPAGASPPDVEDALREPAGGPRVKAGRQDIE